uniref:Uncharacterized protein n=1 Tax=Cacopsylla melanoneura TaxID=428564 RepID=A0A8D8XNE7_9HEMI
MLSSICLPPIICKQNITFLKSFSPSRHHRPFNSLSRPLCSFLVPQLVEKLRNVLADGAVFGAHVVDDLENEVLDKLDDVVDESWLGFVIEVVIGLGLVLGGRCGLGAGLVSFGGVGALSDGDGEESAQQQAE